MKLSLEENLPFSEVCPGCPAPCSQNYGGELCEPAKAWPLVERAIRLGFDPWTIGERDLRWSEDGSHQLEPAFFGRFSPDMSFSKAWGVQDRLKKYWESDPLKQYLERKLAIERVLSGIGIEEMKMPEAVFIREKVGSHALGCRRRMDVDLQCFGGFYPTFITPDFLMKVWEKYRMQILQWHSVLTVKGVAENMRKSFEQSRAGLAMHLKAITPPFSRGLFTASFYREHQCFLGLSLLGEEDHSNWFARGIPWNEQGMPAVPFMMAKTEDWEKSVGPQNPKDPDDPSGFRGAVMLVDGRLIFREKEAPLTEEDVLAFALRFQQLKITGEMPRNFYDRRIIEVPRPRISMRPWTHK